MKFLLYIDVDDDISTGVTNGTISTGHKLKLKKLQEIRLRDLYGSCGSRRLKFQDANPKQFDSATYNRYEIYKTAKTINEYKVLNRRFDDLKWAFSRGHVIIEGIQALHTVQREYKVLNRRFDDFK